jgi:type IV pilus assembly protein PilV
MRKPAAEPAVRLSPLCLQRGVTLLEVMISIIVVSLGLIGVLGSHAKGFANTSSAGYRTQASWMAGAIVERARSNLAGDYTIAIGAATGGTGQAANDLAAWKAQLARALPAGDARVEVVGMADPINGSNVRQMRVLVRWDDRRATGEGGAAGTPQYKYFLTETYLPAP